MVKNPRVIIIAGPNGAGKTTFAREFLPKEAGLPVFINADLIAAGLSPFNPDIAAIQAGRIMLTEIAEKAAKRESFAFETLSGHSYARHISGAKPAIGWNCFSCPWTPRKPPSAGLNPASYKVAITCGKKSSTAVLPVASKISITSSSRSHRLAREVCERFDWRDTRGRYQEMACRKRLGELHQRGLIVLPPRIES